MRSGLGSPCHGQSMSDGVPTIYLARHGETAWSASGQHTGRTDLPLTEARRGECAPAGKRLAPLFFDHVFTSPRIRPRRPANWPASESSRWSITTWPSGITATTKASRTAEIRAARPDWDLFRDGCPGGNGQTDHRPRRPCRRHSRTIDANILVFSSGHILRDRGTLDRAGNIPRSKSPARHCHRQRHGLRPQPRRAGDSVVER